VEADARRAGHRHVRLAPPGRALSACQDGLDISGSHVITISILSMGQFALGGICVWFLLEPVFGIDRKAGALIEMSFDGGHGTLAGLTPVLQQHGVGDLLHVGLGLATIGMIAGIVVGTMLVNYAIKSPSIPVARQNPTSPDEDLDIDHHLPRPDDPRLESGRV
jgi:glutamate:Na+ symporter, ESS family